jgi:hypothetical protein
MIQIRLLALSDQDCGFLRFFRSARLGVSQRKDLYTVQEIEMLEYLGKPARQVEMECQNRYREISLLKLPLHHKVFENNDGSTQFQAIRRCFGLRTLW